MLKIQNFELKQRGRSEEVADVIAFLCSHHLSVERLVRDRVRSIKYF